MSFSSGTFSINSTGQPVVTGTVISSTAFNALTADLATGLSTCMLKDGTQTMTANIPMASFKFTGLGAGSALTDSANISQVQSNTASYLTSVAGTNTITGTATPTPAYAVGQRFTFIPAGANTGATTLNISSLGAGAVQIGGAALAGGELSASYPVTVLVTAATPVFQIIHGAAFFTNSISGDVALNNTSNYFTGPTVAQGAVGTWLAAGSITAWDTSASATLTARLWDGTTVIASGVARPAAGSCPAVISLSGRIASPAGNIRIDVKDETSTNGAILASASGLSKDSTITVTRIS